MNTITEPVVARTITHVVRARRAVVFEFLARPENLPAWATEFCEGIRRENGHYKVLTSAGELFFCIDADRKTGVIDMLIGPTLCDLGIYPCRVFDVAGLGTAIQFTFLRLPGVPEELYERQYRSLEIEMEGLRQRFSA